MKLSDGIIIASPVYPLAESGQVKVFFDHLGCIFMSHRQLQEMFSKTSLIVSTTAGTGTKYVIKSVERSLSFWGIPKILFYIFKNLMNRYSDGHQDKEYWRRKGWLQGKRHW